MGYERFYNEEYAATLTEKDREVYRGFCEKAAQAKAKREKANTARNEYRRKWARANPDKVREQQARYWLKKAGEAATEETTSKEA